MAQGSGFGKTILFGEHFVVYGLPAIVAALNNKSIATIEKIDKKSHEFIDKQPTFTGCPNLTWNTCKAPIIKVLNYLEIKDSLRITLSGNLPLAHSGIGSSAANLVSIVRELNKEYSLGLQDTEINRAAYEGEKVVHGNPSGIDNTVATYGGLFLFQRNEPPAQNTIIPIKLEYDIEREHEL